MKVVMFICLRRGDEMDYPNELPFYCIECQENFKRFEQLDQHECPGESDDA